MESFQIYFLSPFHYLMDLSCVALLSLLKAEVSLSNNPVSGGIYSTPLIMLILRCCLAFIAPLPLCLFF